MDEALLSALPRSGIRRRQGAGDHGQDTAYRRSDASGGLAIQETAPPPTFYLSALRSQLQNIKSETPPEVENYGMRSTRRITCMLQN